MLLEGLRSIHTCVYKYSTGDVMKFFEGDWYLIHFLTPLFSLLQRKFQLFLQLIVNLATV